MRCLHCDRDFPPGFMDEWARSEAAKGGRFNCPHCSADHVRREIGRTPSGEPQYTVRLWGHPTRFRRKQDDRPKD